MSEKMNSLIEELPKIIESQIKEKVKQKCNHSNSITGGKGKYCLDCEKYV